MLPMNIYVGNLAWKTRQKELRELFENFGEVTNAFIVRDKKTRRSRGFGFVEMANKSDALEAIEKLNNTVFHDRTISVNEAIPKEESDSRPRPDDTVTAGTETIDDTASREIGDDSEIRTDPDITDAPADPESSETVSADPDTTDDPADTDSKETAADPDSKETAADPDNNETAADTDTTDDPADPDTPGDEEDQKKKENL